MPKTKLSRIAGFQKCSLFAAGILTGLCSCGSDKDQLPLSSAINQASATPAANGMLSEAKSREAAGNTGKAISIYRDIFKKYPYSDAAAEARYSEGRILDNQGDLLKAFEAYQDLISRYPGSPHYASAIKRQEAVAHAAADGIIKNNFLGMKTKIGPEKTSNMLANVRDNAPRAISAPKAQYAIGRVWQQHGNAQKAISAYQTLTRDYPGNSLAAEALYQKGEILVLKAERGNHNKANVNRATEIFQDLVNQYPRHPRASDARKRIAMLGQQDIQRNYDTAEFYRKKGNTNSALFYYREVVRQTKSGDLHNLAQQRISELGG